MKNLKQNIMLMLAAMIWGVSFVAQSVGVEKVGPFTFNGIRFVMGGLVLLPLILILGRSSRSNAQNTSSVTETVAGSRFEEFLGRPFTTRRLILSGLISGTILGVASSLQQIGIMYTSPGKSGFITALYVVLVPVVSLFLGRKSNILLWISVGMAVIGMYLLCLSETTTVNFGDFLTFLCAIGYTFHIISIDRLGSSVDGVRYSSVQFLTSGTLCIIVSLFTEKYVWADIIAVWIPLLYAGIMSCGVAFTLQVLGQKDNSPVVASLLCSLESVFSVIAAWLILGETLTFRELSGCLIMFGAIVLAQLPSGKEVTNG